MDRELLLNQSPTAQVRIFTEDLLKDGRYHTRKEMAKYIEEKRQFYQLPEFRAGHIAGGIQQATVNCEKGGRGTFRLQADPSEASDEPAAPSRNGEVRQILDLAMKQLADLAHRIDFMEADDEDIAVLTKLKDSAQRIKEIRQMWE